MQYKIPIFYQILPNRKILEKRQILEKKLIIEKKRKDGVLIMKTNLERMTDIRRRTKRQILDHKNRSWKKDRFWE